MENEGTIEVPLYVVEELEEIRKSGKYNMVMDAGKIFDKLYKKRSITFFWLAKINEYTMYARLDRKKYIAALKELGEVRGLVWDLSKD